MPAMKMPRKKKEELLEEEKECMIEEPDAQLVHCVFKPRDAAGFFAGDDQNGIENG